MNNLPDDILYLIYKSYNSRHVLPHLVEKVYNKKRYNIVVSQMGNISEWIYDDPDIEEEGGITLKDVWVDLTGSYQLTLSRFLPIIPQFTIYTAPEYWY